MSEYQYYEFVAVDRPLTPGQMVELRNLSSRAEITRTHFVNHYQWGDFRGDPDRLVERYFDAFLYFANWGTRRVMFGLPGKGFDLRLARACCDGSSPRVHVKSGRVVVDLMSHLDGADDYDQDGRGWLPSLVGVRAELRAGDPRAFYLAWLLGVGEGEHDDDVREPFVPADLDDLTAGQASLAEYLRIDEDLLAAAAAPARAPRSVAQLREAAEVCREKREAREAAQAARAARRRARADAEARARRLAVLARNEARTWREVADLVASKKASAYDRAVALLVDLRDLAGQKGRLAEAQRRIQELCLERLSQRALIDRCKRAGLG